jgi:phosphatidylinositol-binding clathrin assembly protein
LLLLTEARPDPTNPFNSLTNPNRQPSVAAPNGPQTKQNLIDFFASIESEQTSMFPTPQQQQQQFSPQSQVYVNPSFNPAFATAQPTNQFPPPTANQQFYQPPAQQQQPFPAGQQYTAPQQPIRPEWTGAGFGGYTPSSAGSPVHIMPTISSAPPAQASFSPPPATTVPQTQFSSPVQNSGLQADRNSTGTTNPFRASILPYANTFPSDQGTNPFATGQRAQTGISPAITHTPSFNTSQTSFASVPQQQPQQPTYQQPFQTQSQPAFSPTPSQQQQPIFQQSNQSQPVFTPQAPVQVSSSTGTNPFSRVQSQQARLTPQVTGSNPFRQSVMPGGTTTNGFGWSQQ